MHRLCEIRAMVSILKGGGGGGGVFLLSNNSERYYGDDTQSCRLRCLETWLNVRTECDVGSKSFGLI